MASLGTRVRRRVGRVALRAHFLLLQRHRHRRMVLERMAGISLVVLPDVFHPGLFFSSELLAEVVGREPLAGKSVLEVGTGTGFLALLAAQRAARTVGIDINPEAVRALRINALLNHLEDKVEARQGDLFAPVAGEQFDVIIFNPPYFAGEAKDLWEYAWRDVNQVRARFVAQAAGFLRPGGRLLVSDSDIAVDRLEQTLAAGGFRVRPLRTRTVISGETLTVFEASPVG
ncbi:MAG TPA: methyltransferase [Polyangia bacterium]|nr:methyltransferase [Polyangia bacterium]